MLQFHMDHFFTIGKTHAICEDYTLLNLNPLPLLVVCDGCSASNYSDVGARLLAWSAYTWFQQNTVLMPPDYQQIGHAIINHANNAAEQLSLPNEALDATLMLGFLHEHAIYVYVYGDGVVLARNNHNEIHYHEIEFTHNAPYYLNYWRDSARQAEYAAYKLEPLILKDSRTQKALKCRYDTPLSFCFPITEYQSVMLASDGIKQCYHLQQGYIVPVMQAAEAFLSFKSIEGEFVKRRALRALQDYARDGIVPADDLSLAAFAWSAEN